MQHATKVISFHNISWTKTVKHSSLCCNHNSWRCRRFGSVARTSVVHDTLQNESTSEFSSSSEPNASMLSTETLLHVHSKKKSGTSLFDTWLVWLTIPLGANLGVLPVLSSNLTRPTSKNNANCCTALLLIAKIIPNRVMYLSNCV